MEFSSFILGNKTWYNILFHKFGLFIPTPTCNSPKTSPTTLIPFSLSPFLTFFHGLQELQHQLPFPIQAKKKAPWPTLTAPTPTRAHKVSRRSTTPMGPIRRWNSRPIYQRKALAWHLWHCRGGCLGLRPCRSLHAWLQSSHQLCLLRHASWLIRHHHYLPWWLPTLPSNPNPNPNPNLSPPNPTQPPLLHPSRRPVHCHLIPRKRLAPRHRLLSTRHRLHGHRYPTPQRRAPPASTRRFFFL